MNLNLNSRKEIIIRLRINGLNDLKFKILTILGTIHLNIEKLYFCSTQDTALLKTKQIWRKQIRTTCHVYFDASAKLKISDPLHC